MATPTVPELRAFLSLGTAGADDPAKTAYLQGCITRAVQLLADYIGPDYENADGTETPIVPPTVLDGLQLEVAAELYSRKDNVGGAGQAPVLEGAVPVRAPRDPLARVLPTLRRYAGGMP